jgi:glycosyltransferase involved in cell wall biosynthesis
MKIALLHYTAPPVAGGVETILSRQARQLARAGHLVHVLAGRGDVWDARIPVEIIPRLDARHPQVLKARAALSAGRVPSDFNELVRQIQSELAMALKGVDVLIAHNVGSMTKNLALTAALYNLSQLPRTPRLVLWHHDLAWTLPRHQSEIHPGWPWELLRTAWPGVRQATNSEANRQELAAAMGIPLNQITLIQAGLALTDFFGFSPRLAELVDDLQLIFSAPILLTPLRITRRKNLELALHVLGELRRRLPQAALVVTGMVKGQNPLNQVYLEDLLRLRRKLGLDGRAIFLAELLSEGLGESDLPGFYRLADALLLPSREEAFGIPLLEAGLSGLPIFCSELEPLKALAGENATFFDPDGNPEEIAGRIAGRLQIDPLYRMRTRVRREYTWEALYMKQIAPLLEE